MIDKRVPICYFVSTDALVSEQLNLSINPENMLYSSEDVLFIVKVLFNRTTGHTRSC